MNIFYYLIKNSYIYSDLVPVFDMLIVLPAQDSKLMYCYYYKALFVVITFYSGYII